ncbi:MAG: DNA polymerase III subunit delta [Verrucomicrobiales bacterium]|nr:DNA polymerase III subunit delta [Verrucomicrobiales bacterium]
MAEASPAAAAPVSFVWGDDDFAVQKRARELWAGWQSEHPDGDAEVIEGGASNVEEAQKVIGKVREALQTLPFFGGTKSIWLRGCTFLGEDRLSEAQSVVAMMADFGKELAGFRWSGVRLLISAGKVDRRRAFFKVLDKFAVVEQFVGLSADDREWQDKAESLAAGSFRTMGKRIAGDALEIFVAHVGPNTRQLSSEAQKLVDYVGDRPDITAVDVEAVVTKGRHARAFALADAIGDRQLAKALRHLDEELWAMQSDKSKSEIGLLYGVISKVRTMLLARELMAEGQLRSTSDYRRFAAQLKDLPADRFPRDKRFNPAEINPYMFFRAAQQAVNFTTDELVAAMEELLQCNRRLVGSGLEAGLVLQMAVTRILANRPREDQGPRGRS